MEYTVVPGNQQPLTLFQQSFRRPSFGPSGSSRRRPPTKKLLVGDQHRCGVGQCEFFLFCWLGGGVVSGGCGGFLFACCQRPHTLGSEVYVKQVSPQTQSKHQQEKKQVRNGLG